MRIRSIKPDFWKSEKVASLPHAVRLLFIGLWNLADDSGRFRAHPSLVQGELFPYEPRFDVEGCLRALVACGLVLLYDVDGRRYGLVVGFGEHQKIDKRTESRLPPPPVQRRASRAARDPAPADRSSAIARGTPPTSPESSGGTGEESAAPAECSAEPAERSGLDWKGSRRGSGRGETRELPRVSSGSVGEGVLTPSDRSEDVAALLAGAAEGQRSRA